MNEPTAGSGAGDASIVEESSAYQSLFRSYPLPMMIFDVETFDILDVNDSAVRHYGYSRAEFMGLTIRDIRPPEDIPRLEATVARAAGGSYDAGEWRHRLADGSMIDVHIVTHPIRFRGRDARLVSIHDITKRKAAEDRLHLLGTALHASANAVAITDRDARIQWVNPAFTRMTGYPPTEAVGRTHGDLLRSGEQDAAFYEDLWATILDGRVWRGLMVNRRKDGSLYREEQTITPVRDDDGTITHFIAVKEDVTERDARQDRLRFQAQLLAAVGDAVIATDTAGRIVYWNHVAEEMLGWSADEVLGRDILDVTVPADNRHVGAALCDQVLGGVVWAGEFEIARADGTVIPAYTTVSPIFDPVGEIIGAIGVSRDLTTERSLEQQLRHAQKMEAAGRLAGGIAHDFNNLLTSIRGHTEFLLDALSDHKQIEDARAIQESADRASRLTEKLLAFTRKQVRQPRVLDLGNAVRDMEDLLRPLVGQAIVFTIAAPPGIGRIEADAAQLEQVVVNLAVNACDAMPDGGALHIAVGSAEHTELNKRVGDQIEPGPYMYIKVTDTGSGIDPAIVDRLFDPFFTTKPPGLGTGLGLSTVYGIVKQSGGHITVASERGTGSTFCAYFPGVDDPVSPPAAPTSADVPPGRGQSVLVVEDEDSVRILVRRILHRAGYRVIDFATPAAALDATVGAPDDAIDLIITDVVMPGMSGVQMVERILQVHPGTPVIFMSGYVENEAVRRGPVDGAHRFIAKPFAPAQLVALAAELLSAPR